MKRPAIEAGSDTSSIIIKDEDAFTPPSSPPSKTPKKARKTPSTPASGSKAPPDFANGIPGNVARTRRGLYMEMIFEAGLKAVNKQQVQAETGLTPAQQQEMIRKDKGALRKAVGAFVAGL